MKAPAIEKLNWDAQESLLGLTTREKLKAAKRLEEIAAELRRIVAKEKESACRFRLSFSE
jgi:hypothetical protein